MIRPVLLIKSLEGEAMDQSIAQLITKDGEPLSFLRMRLNGRLDGLFFEADVEQSFTNPKTKHVEVVYTFPLPFGAVLLDVKVRLGNQDLTGSVISRKKAELEYEEAISDGNAAIMLERNHDGTHTLNLGNLASNEHCVVRFRYAQVLSFEQRGIRLLIPTVIAPRYGNPITQGKLAPHQVPEHGIDVRYPFEFSIQICGALANASISSPSHPIAVRHAVNESEPSISVTLGANASLDRDLVINLSELEVDSLALLAADMADSHHTASLLSFCPCISKGETDDIAVKFLVDCSGSMSGDSIKAGRRSLQAILAQLKSGDQFSLSKFGDTVDHRSRSLWSIKEATTVGAQRWISELEADMGGTEMENALTSTFNISSPDNSVVFLITDGEIYDIDRLIETAEKSGHRIFVIGIGSSPTEANLRRLAEVTGGSCDFVAPGEAVEPAILRMFARLRSPRAQDLEIQWPEGMKPLWETPLPKSAFDADTINLFALWPKVPQGEVKLIARVDGHSDAVTLATLELCHFHSQETSLSRVAASRHLQALDETQAESLAVTYQLVTPHTNFLLVHERAEEEKALDMPDLIKVKQMLPAGWGGVGSAHAPDVCYSMRPTTSTVMSCMDATSGADSDLTPSRRRDQSLSSLDTSRLHRNVGQVNDVNNTEDSDSKASSKHSKFEERLSEVILCDERPITLVEALIAQPRESWPQLMRELQTMGVSPRVVDWLSTEGKQPEWKNLTETMIVTTFLEALVSMAVFSEKNSNLTKVKGPMYQLISRIMPDESASENSIDPSLFRYFSKSLDGISNDLWPFSISDLLIDFF